jgi:uncharacterized protein YkwD
VVARRTIVVALFLVLVVAPAALARRTLERQTELRSLDTGVLAQLNAIRLAHGLRLLKLNPQLSAAAQGHSIEMLDDGYFAHESFDGDPFWKRFSAYYSSSPHGTWSVGENLLWSSPDVDAAKALQLWMASPEHRQNILAPRWREIGIAAVHADSAPGLYGGQPVTVITTDFGFRG